MVIEIKDSGKSLFDYLKDFVWLLGLPAALLLLLIPEIEENQLKICGLMWALVVLASGAGNFYHKFRKSEKNKDIFKIKLSTQQDKYNDQQNNLQNELETVRKNHEALASSFSKQRNMLAIYTTNYNSLKSIVSVAVCENDTEKLRAVYATFLECELNINQKGS